MILQSSTYELFTGDQRIPSLGIKYLYVQYIPQSMLKLANVSVPSNVKAIG